MSIFARKEIIEYFRLNQGKRASTIELQDEESLPARPGFHLQRFHDDTGFLFIVI